MAKKKKELTVEQKLRALYDLQYIDSRVDQIRNMRGELPLEVEDLENEIQGLEARITKRNDEIKEVTRLVKGHEKEIANAQELIKKYDKQQKNVRNNREFDALSKESEYQTLIIELAEKKIKELNASIAQKTEIIESSEAKKAERAEHLKHKKSELDAILKETQKDEEFLLEKSEEFKQKIEERLLKAYLRIRNNVKNGLAVVPVERGASAGSFFTLPAQRQLEVAARKRIITDEHSGRVLVDLALAQEEGAKIEKLLAKGK